MNRTSNGYRSYCPPAPPCKPQSNPYSRLKDVEADIMAERSRIHWEGSNPRYEAALLAAADALVKLKVYM